MIIFDNFIAELAEFTGHDLYVDAKGACTLLIEEKIKIQLKMDATGENLLMGCRICELPPGKFRENVLKDALKANGQISDNIGILGYLERGNHLALFDEIPSSGLTGEKVYNRLQELTQRALEWKEAIESGQTSPPDAFPRPKTDSSTFGFTR